MSAVVDDFERLNVNEEATDAQVIEETQDEEENVPITEEVHEDDIGKDEPVEPTHIGITVRSLSGAELHFPQLSLEMSVVELKHMIAEQNKNFPANVQKLLKGSTVLKDENFLADYDLKNGDTLHMVKKLGTALSTEGYGGAKDEAPKMSINRNSTSILSVAVPANARAGTRLLINPPGREQMEVVVPPGLRPGDRFQVRIPPSSGASPRAPTQPGSSNGQIMQVRCPNNARGGQRIIIDVPGRGRMAVQVPPGVVPGEYFRFRTPPQY